MPDFVTTSPVSAAIEKLGAAVDGYLAAARPTAPEPIGWELVHLRHQIDRLELVFSSLAAAFAATDEHDRQGSVSPIHWLRHNCNLGFGAVTDRLAVGELAPVLPESIQATEDGRIGFAHMALIARTADAVTGPVREEGSPLDEAPLLDRALEFSVGRFRHFCDKARHAADVNRFVRHEVEAVEVRTLSIKATQNGLVAVRGTLDAEGAAVLRTALEPLARRGGRSDARRRDRRLADALIELAAHATGPAQVQVTTTLETLLQRTGAPAADLEHSIPISAKAVERITCDCSVTRVLLGQDSLVVDVGRSRRLIAPSTRRALKVRDKVCRWPGCDRPATWTAAHHVVHWSQGGPTDLDNLVLLCHRHHWMVHEGGWQIARCDDGGIRTVPPTLDLYQRQARSPDRKAA